MQLELRLVYGYVLTDLPIVIITAIHATAAGLSPSLSDDGGILDSQQAASCKGVEVKIVKTSAWKGDVDKHTFAYDVTFGPETNQFDVLKQVRALSVVVIVVVVVPSVLILVLAPRPRS